MGRTRDFTESHLQNFRSLQLQIVAHHPEHKLQGGAWKFTIYFPRFQNTGERRIEICSLVDFRAMTKMLGEDFGGYNVEPYLVLGLGKRGEEVEKNEHKVVTVLASQWEGTIKYFEALKQELEACSGEEQILILHDVTNIV